jgi:hypothetical protein
MKTALPGSGWLGPLSHSRGVSGIDSSGSPHRVAAANPLAFATRDLSPAARLLPPSATSSLLRLRYWPCLGAWPVVVALIVALPGARWARRDSPFPSAVVCTSAFKPAAREAKRVDASCTALDSRAIRTWTPLPCSATSAALEGLLESQSVFHHPVIYAIENNARAALDTFAGVDPAGGIDAATAHGLLKECTEGAGTEGMPRTVQVMMLDRDYEWSALVLCALVLAALVTGLRRRVRVALDPARCLMVVVERGYLLERRTLALPIDVIADVEVSAGAVGFLSGRRVEIVRYDGSRVPLTEAFVPLTYRVHHQAARRLGALLEGARSRVVLGPGT